MKIKKINSVRDQFRMEHLKRRKEKQKMKISHRIQKRVKQSLGSRLQNLRVQRQKTATKMQLN